MKGGMPADPGRTALLSIEGCGVLVAVASSCAQTADTGNYRHLVLT